jgi:hypothetical protein
MLLAPFLLRRDALEKASTSHQMFAVRDLMVSKPGSAFYRGEVACAFHETNLCQREFASMLASQHQI